MIYGAYLCVAKHVDKYVNICIPNARPREIVCVVRLYVLCVCWLCDGVPINQMHISSEPSHNRRSRCRWVRVPGSLSVRPMRSHSERRGG